MKITCSSISIPLFGDVTVFGVVTEDFLFDVVIIAVLFATTRSINKIFLIV